MHVCDREGVRSSVCPLFRVLFLPKTVQCYDNNVKYEVIIKKPNSALTHPAVAGKK